MTQEIRTPSEEKSVFVSLRIKLLITFTLLFLVAFVAVFLWFYNFATNLAMENLRSDLMAAALTAARAIDGDAHQRLYESGEMDDETYTQIAETLRSVIRTNPKAAGIYTYIHLPDEEGQVRFVVSSILAPGVEPDPRDVEIAAQNECEIPAYERPAIDDTYNWDDGLSPTMLAGVTEAGAETELWADDWGEWLSGYAPIYNAAGEPVGAVGVDMCAVDVIQVQDQVRRTVLPALGVTILILGAVVFFLAHGITRPILKLTNAADQIGQGDYEQDLSPLHGGFVRDEVNTLAQVFEIMVSKVYAREQKLRQRVEELQIIIDEGKRQKQVDEITDSEFFRELQERARKMRAIDDIESQDG
ncbi:MAG: HAMP domain-containing protein [Anaerolineae bacterium]|nr:HAMP domain-containing protein [Anaerolineae bacterium]